MMKKAKSICRAVGCGTLINESGFCDQHKHIEKDRFKGLKKAPGSRKFYGGKRWTQTSKSFRRANPLCAECLRNGIRTAVQLVDHVVERNDLIARGDNPYDWQWLEGLCHKCHNRKLRARQKVNTRAVFNSPSV